MVILIMLMIVLVMVIVLRIMTDLLLSFHPPATLRLVPESELTVNHHLAHSVSAWGKLALKYKFNDVGDGDCGVDDDLEVLPKVEFLNREKVEADNHRRSLRNTLRILRRS